MPTGRAIGIVLELVCVQMLAWRRSPAVVAVQMRRIQSRIVMLVPEGIWGTHVSGHDPALPRKYRIRKRLSNLALLPVSTINDQQDSANVEK